MLLCSCRPLRFVPPLRLSRPSRPLPAPGPGEPPEQQSAEAEADRVQDEYLAVAGQQQRRDHDRNRQPLAPPQEPAEADRDSLDLWNRCQDVLDVHLHLLACCCPRRHPERGSRVMGSVDERRTPPTVGCQTRSGSVACTRPARELNAERPGAKKRSSARVFSWGDRPLEAAVRGAAVLRAGHRTARGKRRRSSAQGWQSPVWGSCGRRGSGQPSVHPDADGRDLRPARVEATAQLSEAEPQAHRTGRSAGPVCNRQAHSDQGVEDEAQGELVSEVSAPPVYGKVARRQA